MDNSGVLSILGDLRERVSTLENVVEDLKEKHRDKDEKFLQMAEDFAQVLKLFEKLSGVVGYHVESQLPKECCRRCAL